MTRDHRQARNFGEFIEAVFGDGIMEHFMRPYNFKVWAHPVEMLNKKWIGERVAVIDVDRALKNVMLGLDDFAWGPNNQFKFPLYGGTGDCGFAGPLEGHYSLNKEVAQIDADEHKVIFTDGETVEYEVLVSAMPLNILCTKLQLRKPVRALRRTRELRHSGGHMVGIGLKQPCPSTKSWMYFPENNCPFYRVTYLSNYSRHMTPKPDTHYSLLCETSYSAFKQVNPDSIIEDTIQGLVNAGMLRKSDPPGHCQRVALSRRLQLSHAVR